LLDRLGVQATVTRTCGDPQTSSTTAKCISSEACSRCHTTVVRDRKSGHAELDAPREAPASDHRWALGPAAKRCTIRTSTPERLRSARRWIDWRS